MQRFHNFQYLQNFYWNDFIFEEGKEKKGDGIEEEAEEERSFSKYNGFSSPLFIFISNQSKIPWWAINNICYTLNKDNDKVSVAYVIISKPGSPGHSSTPLLLFEMMMNRLPMICYTLSIIID